MEYEETKKKKKKNSVAIGVPPGFGAKNPWFFSGFFSGSSPRRTFTAITGVHS